MPLKVQAGGDWQGITAAKVYQGGSWRTLVAAKLYANGAWRDVASFVPPLSVTAAPSPAYGFTTTNTCTSEFVTATPTGGSGPFTYQWSIVSNGGLVTSINSPSLASTYFTRTAMVPGSVIVSAQVVVTDSLGTTAQANVAVYFQRSSSGGGGTIDP